MLDLFSALFGMSMIGDAFDDDASRSNGLRDDDPYHARDFSNEYDFFDEHMDDGNNILTVSRILDCLEKPRQDADKLLFANCLKLIALAKAERQVFASPAFESMIESIVRLACETVCFQSC